MRTASGGTVLPYRSLSPVEQDAAEETRPPAPARADRRFTCMGCDTRVLIESGSDPGAIAETARAQLDAIDARLSRFRPDSELARLNADPRETVPASPLLRVAVRAALWAAESTGGLVDPTLLDVIERVGYRHSLTGIARVGLADALEQAPPRRPAAAPTERRWRAIEVDERAGTITRPPGLRLDTGGTTKGLAADAVVHRLSARRCVVDCGGDLRIDAGGDLRIDAGGGEPYGVVVEHPLTREPACTIPVARGAVATSGPGRRLWREAHGRIAHHLIDPATGRPAWTGLISVTAVAPTALEAETLAKVALLLGPDSARQVLAERGGVLIHDSGDVERLLPVALPEVATR